MNNTELKLLRVFLGDEDWFVDRREDCVKIYTDEDGLIATVSYELHDKIRNYINDIKNTHVYKALNE